MRGKMLNIDYTHHLLYSRTAERVIRRRLRETYPEDQTLWPETQRIYCDFLRELPYLGGKSNFQAQSVYDCIALFAYYQAVPEKPGLREFESMVEQLFVSPYARLSPVNWRWRWVQRAAQKIFTRLARNSRLHQEDWPGNYRMFSEPFAPGKGVRFHYESCPIADFARTHGFQHLMPAMCNPDYTSMAQIKAVLIRTTTCAFGPVCDYRLVSQDSPLVREHPLYTDEDGFLRNK